ncbi:hypothetical protein BC332_31148 [Capsicum chinense]|nr:hypothetical protein BC332_31148 [Capsicum chinense]
MMLEVKGSSSSGIVICANGTSLNFTPREFAIVTSLNCVSNTYEFVFDESVQNRIVEKYFNGAEIIQKRQLFIVFTEKVWEENNDKDTEKLAIMYFLHSFVLSNNETVVIPRLHFNSIVLKNIEPTQMELAKFQIPQKDVIEDERSFDSDDDFQNPPPKQINDNLKKKQKVNSSTKASKKLLRKNSVNIIDEHTQKRTSAPRTAKAAEMKTPIFNHIEEKAVSKSESHAETEAFISKKVFDAFRDEQQYEEKDPEPQHMDYAGAKTSPQRFNPNVDQILDKNQNGTKGWTDLHQEKINVEIDSQHLIPDELLRSIHLDYIHSEKIVHHDGQAGLDTEEQIRTPPKIQEVTTDEQRDDPVWPNSQNTIPDELLPWRSAGNIHKFPQKHPFVYHPIDGIVYTKIVKKFMYRISVDLLRVHGKRSYKFSIVDYNFMNIIKVVHDVYSVDDPNLMVGEQEAHLVEYINGFRMHAAVPWHTVKDIYILVNIKEKHHWVLAVLSFSERCIFLYNSYESSGHYPIVLAEIEKLAEIIPLCLQVYDFYDKKEIDLQNHPRYKDKDSSDMFDVLFEENLPQQPSESLDCGVYMVAYAKCLSYGHKILSTDFDPDALRRTYEALLWDYGIQK